MLGKIEGKMRSGQQSMRWLDGNHLKLDGHEFKQTLGDSEGQGSLACCSSSGCRADMTKRLNNKAIPEIMFKESMNLQWGISCNPHPLLIFISHLFVQQCTMLKG